MNNDTKESNMKNYVILMLMLIVVAACSNDDGYNADTAKTPYEPLPAEDYRMVKSVKINYTDDKAREHKWEYLFDYDAQNRIKSIDGEITRFVVNPKNKKIYRKNITSEIKYYFTADDGLKTVYSASVEYPQYTDWNTNVTHKYAGTFNSKGYLMRFGPFDCVYSGNRLTDAHFDNGRAYTLVRDRDENVTGYRCNMSDTAYVDKSNIYTYSREKNRTNIDFSGLLGYWVIERDIAGNETWLDPILQLAAFDMLGSRSRMLPAGEWRMENGYPVSCKTTDGYNLVIEYLE